MAELTESTDQEIIDELVSRDHFVVVTVGAGAAPGGRDSVAVNRTTAIDKRRTVNILHAAAERLEAAGSS